MLQSKFVRESDADIRIWFMRYDEDLDKIKTGLTLPQLKVNLEGQRDIKQTWRTSVENMASIHMGFRFGKYDPIKLNRLPDDSINVPDGGHRLLATQYLYKELMDATIEVLYFEEYVKFLFHQEISVPNFDTKDVIMNIAGGQQTIRRGMKDISLNKALANV